MAWYMYDTELQRNVAEISGHNSDARHNGVGDKTDEAEEARKARNGLTSLSKGVCSLRREQMTGNSQT